MQINIVLIEPEIPQNTGNIVRTCAATGSKLHLIKPLGFEISDKYLKRAGLDYWQYAEIKYYDSFKELTDIAGKSKLFFASTKAQKVYSDVSYSDGCYIVFGKETKGIDEKILKDNYSNCIRIPMQSTSRSLNLSNSVAVVLYEALRQSGFTNLEKAGKLTQY
ncbi:MAG: tRNA (uridine(34)/cytosine(34)/5-carboxymethylaminomethyluridine(34)-2'-O)-methyltransferase TrmL [Clostridia bacterium]|nr:tRNA (uridine(34)/cytosine(34)/5-carboxymethylaminomethyluridine(34)-2'-O)-methyltransferase TrmL [Clostridia bacterium]